MDGTCEIYAGEKWPNEGTKQSEKAAEEQKPDQNPSTLKTPLTPDWEEELRVPASLPYNTPPHLPSVMMYRVRLFLLSSTFTQPAICRRVFAVADFSD